MNFYKFKMMYKKFIKKSLCFMLIVVLITSSSSTSTIRGLLRSKAYKNSHPVGLINRYYETSNHPNRFVRSIVKNSRENYIDDFDKPRKFQVKKKYYTLEKELNDIPYSTYYTGLKEPQEEAPYYTGLKEPQEEVPYYTGLKEPQEEAPYYTGLKEPQEEAPYYTGLKEPQEEAPYYTGLKEPQEEASSQQIDQTNIIDYENSRRILGGIENIINPNQDQTVIKLIQGIKQYYSDLISLNTLYKATSQVVAGKIYCLYFQFSFINHSKLQYMIKISSNIQQKGKITYKITQSDYINLPLKQYKQVLNILEMKGMKNISQELLKQLPRQLQKDHPDIYKELVEKNVKMNKIYESLPFYMIQLQTQSYLITTQLQIDFAKNNVILKQIKFRSNQQSQQQNDNQNLPTYTIDIKPFKYISEVSITDPALISLLTESLDFTQEQMDEIVTYLIVKANIEQNFKIILVNKNDYGLRMVLQIIQTEDMYEAVLEYTSQYIELLAWRQIPSLLDICPDVFKKYYSVNADSQAVTELKRIFRGQSQLSNLKKIINCDKRINADGIYIKYVLLSQSSFIYEVQIYKKPENNFEEVLKYYILDTHYEDTKEIRLLQIPVSNAGFNKTIKLINQKYPSIYANSDILYLAHSENDSYDFYRLVFGSFAGKYEMVVQSTKFPGNARIVRWQKLQNGYVAIDAIQANKQFYFNQMMKQTKRYLDKIFDRTQDQFDQIEVRTLPNNTQYYRLYYKNPVPFVLCVERNQLLRKNIIHGIQSISIVPKNLYYTDQQFAGYKQVKVQSLKNDKYYNQIIKQLIQHQPQLKWAQQILSVFRSFIDNEIRYKILIHFKIKQIATINIDLDTNKAYYYGLIPYQSAVAPGNYRWKCSQINSVNQECSKCEAGYNLESGICYRNIDGCLLQYASSCFICEAGWIRSEDKCLERIDLLQEIQQNKTDSRQTRMMITTTQSRYSYFSTNLNSRNCLKFDGQVCIQCPNSYKLCEGTCKKELRLRKNY